MNKAEKFNRDVLHIISQLNPKISDRCSTIETLYGDIDITLHNPEPQSKVFSIFMKFKEVERAKGHISGMNQYSGKWNIHQYTPEGAIEDFQERLKIVLPTITLFDVITDDVITNKEVAIA